MTTSLVAVLLGAANWPDWSSLDNSTFERSHEAFHAYLKSTLGLSSDDILDLFGLDDSPSTQVQKIQKFLNDVSERTENPASDVIIYYVGHGDSYQEDKYAILTACASEDRPAASSFHSDYLMEALKPTVGKLRAYLILDACFSAAAVRSFSKPVGSAGISILASASSGDTSIAPRDAQATVFTNALLSVLKRGEPQADPRLSLRVISGLTRDEIEALGQQDYSLPELHSPHQRRRDVADFGIFPNEAFRYRKAHLANPETKSWCAIVSESDLASEDGPFRDGISGFIDGYRGEILSTTGWLLKDKPDVIETRGVFESPRSFQNYAALACQADIAFFDLAGLDPAALVLLGIRSVIRRGVTICTTGDRDQAAITEVPPFLLRDVNYCAPSSQIEALEDAFGRRALTGVLQLEQQPQDYSDLPVYDLARRTLTDVGGRTSRQYFESVLMLCPFTDTYTGSNWNEISRRLRGAIEQRAARDELKKDPSVKVAIERTLDMRSPQVVSTNLIQAMRMNELCICDLTEWRPNVLFELGVRLAIHQLDPICILDDYNDGLTATGEGPTSVSQQRENLMKVLNGLRYRPKVRESYYELIDRHLSQRQSLSSARRRTWSGSELPIGGIYGVAWQHADRNHEPSAVSALDLLRADIADVQSRSRGSTSLLYPALHFLTSEALSNATERLIAAWFYLKFRRIKVDESALQGELKLDVGNQLIELLADSRDESARELRDAIILELAELQKEAT